MRRGRSWKTHCVVKRARDGPQFSSARGAKHEASSRAPSKHLFHPTVTPPLESGMVVKDFTTANARQLGGGRAVAGKRSTMTRLSHRGQQQCHSFSIARGFCTAAGKVRLRGESDVVWPSGDNT